MLSGSVLAGVICAIASLPMDNIKTKLMKMKKDKDGIYPYKGITDWLK